MYRIYLIILLLRVCRNEFWAQNSSPIWKFPVTIIGASLPSIASNSQPSLHNSFEQLFKSNPERRTKIEEWTFLEHRSIWALTTFRRTKAVLDVYLINLSLPQQTFCGGLLLLNATYSNDFHMELTYHLKSSKG